MFLLYLDESGIPESHPDQTTHYVVVGIAVHEGTWFALDKQIAGVKRRFGLDPNSHELHTAWVLSRYREQEEIEGFEALSWTARRDAVRETRDRKLSEPTGKPGRRLKTKRAFYRKTAAFTHLLRSERRDLVRSAVEVVAKYRRGLYLFGEAIDKSTLNPAIDPLHESFDHMVTRFEKFLKTRRQATWGLIAADHNDTQVKRLPKLLVDFQREGTRWENIDRVIESPFFVDSAQCSGVQVADLCAYALRRYLENQDDELFKPIFPKFFRYRKRLVGLRHFTERGCPCLICRERGHD